MGVNSLPKTVTRQRRECDLNPGNSAPESSTLTTRLLDNGLDLYSLVARCLSGFYRAMLCIRGTSHGCLSVSVSVTSRSSTKTAKRRIT